MMGQFSWLCCACDEQILSEGEDWTCFKCETDFAGKESVAMLIPSQFNAEHLTEDDYEGYGVFGGIDAYSLLARMNGISDLPLLSEYDSDRGEGIDLAFDKFNKIKYHIKIIHSRCHKWRNQNLKLYEYYTASQDDPDQGWQQDAVKEGNLTICSDCADGGW
jgi:hypothetical protein